MLSSSIISSHLLTMLLGISVPSAIMAELSSFPYIPTNVLNHIFLPFLPSKTLVNGLGPKIVFTPPLSSHSTSIPSALALCQIYGVWAMKVSDFCVWAMKEPSVLICPLLIGCFILSV